MICDITNPGPIFNIYRSEIWKPEASGEEQASCPTATLMKRKTLVCYNGGKILMH